MMSFDSTNSVRQSMIVTKWYGRRLIAKLLFSSTAFLFLGCQLAPKNNTSHWLWKKEVAQITPDRVLPVWTDSVLHQTNQPGIRGFGGRLYFYGKDSTDPVEVDGSLAVYVFDADDSSPSNQKPLRKFMFTADQFKTHMSKTSIGPSYSVWLPWGEVGGPPARLSIIARYEGREGGTTISDPTIKMLPGVPVGKEVAKSEQDVPGANASRISLAGHDEPAKTKGKKNELDDAKEIETIELPPAFQRHLHGARSSHSLQASPRETLPTAGSTAASLPQQVRKSDGAEISDQNESESPVVAPITTQVYDYRTRGRLNASPFASKTAKNDIREGRWIKEIARNEKRN
jgi:hypothetical protein